MIWIAAALALFPSSGLHWEPLMEPGCGGAMTDIAISPHNPKLVLVAGDMLGVGRSTDLGDHWLPTFGLRSYECASFSFHPKYPNTVWVGTMGGPHVSHDGGQHWELKRNGMPTPSDWSYTAPIEQVLYDPTDAHRLLAIGGSSRNWDAWGGTPDWGAIWESRDDGEHWSKIGAINAEQAKTDHTGTGRNIVSAVFDLTSPNVIYAAVLNNGLWKSVDAGRHWNRVGEGIKGSNIRRLSVSRSNPKAIWASTGPNRAMDSGLYEPGGVFVSLDQGNTFQAKLAGLNQGVSDQYFLSAGYQGFATSETDPNFLAIGDEAWNTGVIYTSHDKGTSWKPVATKGNIGQPESRHNAQVAKVSTALFAGLGVNKIIVSPHNPKVLFAINSELIVRSTDGGVTWIDSASRPNGDGWTGRGYTGWCTRQIKFDPYTRDRSLLQAMDAGRAWLSTDGLRSWRYGAGFPTPWNCGVDSAWTKTGRAYACFGQFNSFGGIGVSQNGGKDWNVIAGPEHGLPTSGAQIDPTSIATDPQNPDHLWSVIGGELYESLNGAKSFSQVDAGSDLDCIVKAGNLCYVSGSRGVSVSRDGKSWASIGGPIPANQMVAMGNGDLLVVSKKGDRRGLWRYRKTKAQPGVWKRLLDESLISSLAVDPKDGRRLLITTAADPFMDLCPASGVWVSEDSGVSWSLQNDGLPMLRGSCAAFDPFSNSVVFGSYGRGFFRASWPISKSLIGTRSYTSTADDARFSEVLIRGGHSPLLIKNGSMTEGSN